MNTPAPLRHILIVGGGSAGWMSAHLLHHHWGARGVRISVVESADIGSIGVGEGSTPFMRQFFAQLGIEEAEWMPACHATYKCGIRFPGWSTVPGYESYVHPFFHAQDQEIGGAFFPNTGLRRRGWDAAANPTDFFLGAELARQCKAPKPLPQPGGAPQTGADYAYHFDALLLGRFLRGRAIARGVQHHVGTVASVLRHENGDIAALQLDDGRRLEADFFIDCSGFRGLLINEALGEPFVSYKGNLFNDRAIAIPTPADPAPGLPSETVSTALRHGWAWRIPLTHRFGNGYVYASDFVSDEAAERELRQHLGAAAEGQEARRLCMRVGRVEQHWKHNCLAIGLSQGFIEPLEATALMLIQFSLQCFIALMERGEFTPRHREAVNRHIRLMFEGVRDYVVGHYRLNTREDSEYWRANRAHREVSEVWTSLLDVWDRGGDFDAELASWGEDLMYTRPSWYCLLAGMGRFPAGLRPLSPASRSLSSAAARTGLASLAAQFQDQQRYLRELR